MVRPGASKALEELLREERNAKARKRRREGPRKELTADERRAIMFPLSTRSGPS